MRKGLWRRRGKRRKGKMMVRGEERRGEGGGWGFRECVGVGGFLLSLKERMRDNPQDFFKKFKIQKRRIPL